VRARSEEWVSSKNWGGEENTFSLGGCTLSSNVYFKAEASKVAMHERKPFDEGLTGGKREAPLSYKS